MIDDEFQNLTTEQQIQLLLNRTEKLIQHTNIIAERINLHGKILQNLIDSTRRLIPEMKGQLKDSTSLEANVQVLQEEIKSHIKSHPDKKAK